MVNIKTENQFLDLKKASNQLSLVILAGGLGSRYNGQKQIDGVGPNQECLMEYSIYDALKVGIRHFVFIINDKFESTTQDYFKKIIEKNKATVNFVTQTTRTNVTAKFLNPDFNREKPWGTAHALLVAKKFLKNPFVVINADDYYGKNAFDKAIDWLKSDQITEEQYGMVAYQLVNTLSENGSVSRGICNIKQENLLNVIERTNIYQLNNEVFYQELDVITKIEANIPVSMNFWILHPSIFDYLEQKFEQFLELNSQSLKAEFYLPQSINELIDNFDITVKANISNELWFGMTYPADKAIVQQQLILKILNKEYPEQLWQII